MQILKRIIKWALQLLATAAAREVIRQGWEFLKQLLEGSEQQ